MTTLDSLSVQEAGDFGRSLLKFMGGNRQHELTQKIHHYFSTIPNNGGGKDLERLNKALQHDVSILDQGIGAPKVVSNAQRVCTTSVIDLLTPGKSHLSQDEMRELADLIQTHMPAHVNVHEALRDSVAKAAVGAAPLPPPSPAAPLPSSSTTTTSHATGPAPAAHIDPAAAATPPPTAAPPAPKPAAVQKSWVSRVGASTKSHLLSFDHGKTALAFKWGAVGLGAIGTTWLIYKATHRKSQEQGQDADISR